ncbi:hypothetical protein DFP72DRAFT_362020 [Ephemerocybe angulata]|uniref:Uncharacterized protein n=1 Tax=Ephemerocybe angulata TaxID=980116 RepID=A0A8H6HWT8_9AGAR|nr:hypothetical protein DFP72DRAFT_362020 [Tulosesus angulatus]
MTVLQHCWCILIESCSCRRVVDRWLGLRRNYTSPGQRRRLHPILCITQVYASISFNPADSSHFTTLFLPTHFRRSYNPSPTLAAPPLPILSRRSRFAHFFRQQLRPKRTGPRTRLGCLRTSNFSPASASHSLGGLERKARHAAAGLSHVEGSTYERLTSRIRPESSHTLPNRFLAQERPISSCPCTHRRPAASIAGIASEHHHVLRHIGTSSEAPANPRKHPLRASKFRPVRLLAHGNSDKLKTSAGEASFEQHSCSLSSPVVVFSASGSVYPGVLPRFLSGLASFA